MLRSRLFRGALAGLAFFGLIQVVPWRVTNPPERASPPWDSAETRSLVVKACYDCHSNETHTPWYERIAPVSWWIATHVQDGREAMNLSMRTGASLFDGSREVESGSMPPGYYTWLGLHSAARLSPAQRRALVRGLQATAERAQGTG